MNAAKGCHGSFMLRDTSSEICQSCRQFESCGVVVKKTFAAGGLDHLNEYKFKHGAPGKKRIVRIVNQTKGDRA